MISLLKRIWRWLFERNEIRPMDLRGLKVGTSRDAGGAMEIRQANWAAEKNKGE